MKALSEIEHQLSRLGINNRFWGKPEVRELQHILTHDEVITNAVNGRYEGGFALLVVTDRRLLLIDKKMWFLSMEDVRYDMVSEIDYCARLLDATLSLQTITKTLRFTSIRQKNLRALTAYIQDKVMELKQQADWQAHAPQDQQSYQYSLHPIHKQQQAASAATGLKQIVAQTSATGLSQPVLRLPLRPFKRLGAYPTASLTMSRRFSR